MLLCTHQEIINKYYVCMSCYEKKNQEYMYNNYTICLKQMYIILITHLYIIIAKLKKY